MRRMRISEYKVTKDRPMSWSSISSFEWNKDQWYRRYILKELSEITPELKFGSFVDKKIESDPNYLPAIIRYPVMQYKMISEWGDIPLVGIADTYRPRPNRLVKVTPAIRDYKTGRKPWDRTRANETGQLTMYCLLLWQLHRIRPEEVELWIDWMPTHYVDREIQFIKEGEVRSFKTSRTMGDVLEFGQRIEDTYRSMIEYVARRASEPLHVPVPPAHRVSSLLR